METGCPDSSIHNEIQIWHKKSPPSEDSGLHEEHIIKIDYLFISASIASNLSPMFRL